MDRHEFMIGKARKRLKIVRLKVNYSAKSPEYKKFMRGSEFIYLSDIENKILLRGYTDEICGFYVEVSKETFQDYFEIPKND